MSMRIFRARSQSPDDSLSFFLNSIRYSRACSRRTTASDVSAAKIGAGALGNLSARTTEPFISSAMCSLPIDSKSSSGLMPSIAFFLRYFLTLMNLDHPVLLEDGGRQH